MASRVSFPVVLAAAGVAALALWWIGSRPDPGAVERARDEPDAFGSGVPNELTGPVVRLTARGGAGADADGVVTAGSLWLDADDTTVTATSLVDGEPVWTYEREDRSIDRWTVSGDAAWVLFDDHLLVRVDIGGGRVDDATEFGRLYDDDDPPGLDGDGFGGVVLTGPSGMTRPVWWVGPDLEPVPLRLPRPCDTYDDADSDGERIYLIAHCAGDARRVMAFGTDGTVQWEQEPSPAQRLEVDRGQLIVHETAGGVLVDAASGETVADIPAGPQRLSYVAAAEGLVVAWSGDAPPDRSSLAVWSVDEQGFVWRLPGRGEQGEVSAPLVSDGQVYYTETTYGDEPRHRLVVADVESGGATSTGLTAPEADGCDASYRPRIRAGLPGAIVVSWQDDAGCGEPIVEVYADAG